MNIVFYSPEQGQTEENLQRVIASIIPQGRAEVYRDIASLMEKLRQPKKDLTIVLLITDKQDDLVRLLTVGDLFHNTRLIFIAPDRTTETNALVRQRRIFGCLNDKTICIQGRPRFRRGLQRPQQYHGRLSEPSRQRREVGIMQAAAQTNPARYRTYAGQRDYDNAL